MATVNDEREESLEHRLRVYRDALRAERRESSAAELIDEAIRRLKSRPPPPSLGKSEAGHERGLLEHEQRERARLTAENAWLREIVGKLHTQIDHCPVCLASRRPDARLEHGLSCDIGRAMVSGARGSEDPGGSNSEPVHAKASGRHQAALRKLVVAAGDHLHEYAECPFCELGKRGEEDLGTPGPKHDAACPLAGYELTVDLEALLAYAGGARTCSETARVGTSWLPKIDDRVVHELALAHGAYGFGTVVGVPWPEWVRVRWDRCHDDTFEHVTNVVQLAPVDEKGGSR